MAGGAGPGASYTKKVAFIYIFNLVVGVGALALPLAFKEAGMILGVIFLAFCSFLAYICITFIIETMAASNALLKLEQMRQENDETMALAASKSVIVSMSSNSDPPIVHASESETESLLQTPSSSPSSFNHATIASDTTVTPTEASTLHLQDVKASKKRSTSKKQKKSLTREELEYYANPFAIETRTEIGLLSSQFLGPVGKYLFYFIIWIYLFGDLAIYAVAVPSTLLKVTGALFGLSHGGTYRIFVALFGCVVVPFSFLNFQKTKYLQMFTLFTRNLAFCIMILLSVIFVIQGNGASIKNLTLFRPQGLGTLYGTAIYAFMCHHSLPSIVSPIKNKRRLSVLFAGDFLMIFVAYIVLCYSALFAFGDQPLAKCPDHVRPGPPCQIQKLFTLNFTSYHIVFIGGFLALFPVFTLTTNYPLISITMRNNLQTLFEPIRVIREFKFNGILFSALSAIPPIIVALITDNLSFLVSLTGSIAGVFIQFIFPALLVLLSRRKMRRLCDEMGVEYTNPHTSPFSHAIWAILIVIVGSIGFFIAVALQIVDLVQTYKHK